MPSSRVNFIGVVTYITSPSKALTGDWKCRLNLGDPSNTIVENFSNNEAGFSINFFTKKYLQWLPCPKQGDILILHDIKVVRWQGTISGVGYPDRFRWAIYLPDKGDVYYGQLGNVPESEGAADGLGYAYSPFLQPSASEIKYALNLSDWWRSVLKKRKDAMGEVQQIGGGVNQFSSLSTKRQHQLICEVSLDSSSHGYFDCTVEVLHGWANSNPNVYSLYVTDYTRNAQTRPCTSQWCSVSLQDYVLQIEMWDAAANIGETMRAGEFYHIQNVRLQVRKSGYLEGKLNENKIRLLSEHETASNHHLQALLDRKEAWTKTHDSDGGFEHQLIRDVVADKFFNCSVEILHVELALDAEKGDLPSYIYVTDYTKHSDISFNPGDLKGSIPWPDNLEGRVVKIAMLGKQAAMAKYVVVGSYYLIKKLRLKYTTVGRELRGWLGGGEKLICQLRADNVELQSLLQRKKEWNSINEINPRTEERSQESKMLRIKQSVSTFDRHFSSIKEVNACPISPNKFRVVAKLVDFYPPTLQNAAIAYCRQCKEDIPETRKACYNCADSDHEFVQYRYQLFVLLQDEAGDTIKLSINDRCSLFDGLKRCDIRENITVCNDFCRRLEPLIGSVTKLREGRIDIDQIPFLSLVIYHWLTSKGQQAYSLADFEGVF
ncbi:hypothetical protein BDQ17DRAFT_435738 [Cyathus striatus]|nr:hypothetical protein BDQ17DRAFT_435738 [Cyathus striatus]